MPEHPLARYLPEGVARPSDIPDPLFAAAVRAYEAGRQLEMGALAEELGMSRATLYRRVGSRERLFGAVLWYFSRQALDAALRASDDLRGAARIVAVLERYLDLVLPRRPLRALLHRDPGGTLRLLTASDSVVHRGLRDVLEGVFAEEEERGEMALTIDRQTLAYITVRLAESLIYADVVERDAAPDRRIAVDAVARLLAGSQVGAMPRPQAATA